MNFDRDSNWIPASGEDAGSDFSHTRETPLIHNSFGLHFGREFPPENLSQKSAKQRIPVNQTHEQSPCKTRTKVDRNSDSFLLERLPDR